MKLVNLLYFSLINSHDDQNLIEKVFFFKMMSFVK